MAHWYALYTKPHKELQVRSFLKSEGYEVYLPTIGVRRRGRQKVVPFLSCYLFARLSGPVDFPAVRWSPGLRRIVRFGSRPATVPDSVISLMRERLARLQEAGCPVHSFRRGDRLRIMSGPFTDLEAVFEESLSSRDRGKILVDFLGRWTRCEIEIDSLKKVR